MEVRFVQAGNAVCLRLNYDKLKKWTETHGLEPYQPDLVPERSGATKDADGAEIRLRRLHRTRAIDAVEIRKGLARRLSFIGPKFVVIVNGQGVQPGDRVARSKCRPELTWDVAQIPMGDRIPTGDQVTGWIGFLSESSQTSRGVDIFANHKAAELGTYFGFSSTHAQWARAYLVGEIHADFLDDREDLIATARNSVVWESSIGLALQDWGQRVMKWAFDQWVEAQRIDKQEKAVKNSGFDKWLEMRFPSEKRVAQRMVKLIVDDPAIEPDSAGRLFEIVKSSVESKAFHELVDTIETEGSNVAALLRLFNEWRVIEAREHLRLADGRLEAIEKLGAFIKAGALEVQQMQPLFEKHPWLIDPAWSEVEGQTTYTDMLRKKWVEPAALAEEDRRLDILGIRASGGVCVVEIKRPEKTLAKDDLNQIADYVDWGRVHFLGTGPDSPKYVTGLLIVGKMNSQGEYKEKLRRLAGDDIRVLTFADIYERASEYYKTVERQLEKVAPEYTRSRRKATKKSS